MNESGLAANWLSDLFREYRTEIFRRLHKLERAVKEHHKSGPIGKSDRLRAVLAEALKMADEQTKQIRDNPELKLPPPERSAAKHVFEKLGVPYP